MERNQDHQVHGRIISLGSEPANGKEYILLYSCWFGRLNREDLHREWTLDSEMGEEVDEQNIAQDGKQEWVYSVNRLSRTLSIDELEKVYAKEFQTLMLFMDEAFLSEELESKMELNRSFGKTNKQALLFLRLIKPGWTPDYSAFRADRLNR